MKKILLSIALFSSIYLSAQAVIVDEKYTDISKPVDFKYLPKSKKFILFKSNEVKSSFFSAITDAYLYEIDGTKSILFENKKIINCNLTPIDKDDIVENIKYFGRYEAYRSYYQRGRWKNSKLCSTYNDLYELKLINQKNKDKINFEKDEIFLESSNLKTNSKIRTKLETTKLELLKEKSLVKSSDPVAFTCKLKVNDSFDFVTKSLSVNQNETTFYKTTYGIDGKKIKDVTLKLNLDNNFFILSNNGAGYVDLFKYNVQAVNNYYEDPANDDIYVYGIYSNKKSKVFKDFNAIGFYIFKFDKDGNKIWESINPIDDRNFQSHHYSASFGINLFEYEDKLVFTNCANTTVEFTNYALVDKSSGKVLKTNGVDYNRVASFEKANVFISESNESKDLLRKVFDPISFAAMDLNPKLFNYLKAIPQKSDRIYFNTIFSSEGIWLIETDNKEYYKVLLFKD